MYYVSQQQWSHSPWSSRPWTHPGLESNVRPVLDPELKSANQRSFGLGVRAARKEVGISQEKLAALAGLDRAYVGHVENGRRNISLNAMWQLAYALNVTPAYFFERAPHLSVPIAKEREAGQA